MSEKEWIQQLEAQGLKSISVVTLEPNFVPGSHTHEVETIHVILKGELTIRDEEGARVFHAGERVDFQSGTTHEALFGPDGCTMIVATREL